MKILICAFVILCASAQTAAANPALYVAKFLGEYIAGKALDNMFGNDLDEQLHSLEVTLSRVDNQLSRQITALRTELKTKPSKKQVRAIVQSVLRELEQTIAELEERQTRVEIRVQEIEDLFGMIPVIPPAPLLHSSVMVGKPVTHPLTADWIQLLCKSEENRTELIRLRQLYTKQSPRMIAALKQKEMILAEIAALHKRTQEEIAAKLPERSRLLKELKTNHPRVRAFDDVSASLLWLVGVTKPIADGPNKGRLGIPRDLLGSKASELFIAFDLTGVDSGVTISLIRQLLEQESRKCNELKPISLPPVMEPLHKKAIDLLRQGRVLQSAASKNDAKMHAALAKFTLLHPTVVELQNEKSELIAKMETLHGELETALDAALRSYVRTLKTNRPTNEEMTQLRVRVLFPILRLTRRIRCLDWKDPLLVRETWKRVIVTPLWLDYQTIISSRFRELAFSPDGTRLASGSHGGIIRLWDVESGKLLKTITGHARLISSLSFSPDGTSLASGSFDDTIKLWDAQSGKLLKTITDARFLDCLSFSPDGTRLASGSHGGIIRLWDVESGKLLKTFRNVKFLACLYFSSDGTRLVSGSDDYTIKVWDAQSGMLLKTFTGPANKLSSCAFSPDGTRFVSGSRDHRITLWDAQRGELEMTLLGHTDRVTCVFFSPDGTRLASASADNTIKLWDAQSGMLLKTLTGHTGVVQEVTFSADGSVLVSGSSDDTIRLWFLE